MAKPTPILTTTIIIVVVSIIVACASDDRPPLMFAAASLVDVMEEVQFAYEHETGQSVRFNFAGSNLIANQVISGAPADGVIVAGQTSIDKLVKANKASKSDAVEIISNRLLAVRPANAATSHTKLEDLVGVGKIAMPDPDTAPAGEYFEAVLRERGIWDALQPQIIPALDARSALAAAATRNVAYALVYETDAVSTDDVEIAFAIESNSVATTPRYYATPLLDNDATTNFIQFLGTPQAVAIFEKYGFRR